MGCNDMVPIGELIEFSRGGGWGSESPFDGSVRVAVIRGADFPSLQQGNYTGLPIRFEKKAKVRSVELHAGDIVLENSGGTATRPTGRTVLITQTLIDSYDCPVIPASFCRLLRFSPSIDSTFAYYWLQEMYHAGRTWGYQNRSTGLSNFQFKVFSAKECMPGISAEEQRHIACILAEIDKKIVLNNRTNGYLAVMCDTVFSEQFGSIEDNAVLSDIADITMGQSPSGKSYNEDGDGTVFYQGRGEFGWRFPSQRLFTTEPKRMAKEGDVLMSVRAPVGDLNVAYEDCCIGRGLAAIHSQYPSYCLYLMRSLGKKLDAYNGEGTVFGSINGKALNGLEIGLPDVDAIKAFEAFAHPVDLQIRANVTEERCLETLRDTLLPKLMSGEIDVSQIELSTQPNSHLYAC